MQPDERGPAAIRRYCEQRPFSDRVIEGGLDFLISRWERTAQHVTDGYPLEIENYLYDLDVRRIIREVWPLASDGQIQAYQHRLEEADRKFRDGTKARRRCIWGDGTAARRG